MPSFLLQNIEADCRISVESKDGITDELYIHTAVRGRNFIHGLDE